MCTVVHNLIYIQIRLLYFPLQLHSFTDGKLLCPSLCDWLSSCGILGISSAGSNEIQTIYIRLVKHYIYHR